LHRQLHKDRHGFSLIELLVVIAIISLMTSILLPCLGKAKQQAQRTVCASNLRQINLSMQYYLDDHDRTYPCAQDPVSTSPFYWLWMGRGWRGLVGPYIEAGIDQRNPSVLFCQVDQAAQQKYESTSYAYSMSFYHSSEQIDSMNATADTYKNPTPSVARTDEDVLNPSGKIVIGEWLSNHDPIGDDKGWWCWQGTRNYLFADGGIQFLPAEDIREARDGLPDPNLTVGGLAGADWPK